MANEIELISILRQYFFPKWLKVLYNWLDKQPNFSEIKQWYLKWRSQFPFEWFSKELVVCQGFTIALRMIEFCIDNKAVAGAQMASFSIYFVNKHTNFTIIIVYKLSLFLNKLYSFLFYLSKNIVFLRSTFLCTNG